MVLRAIIFESGEGSDFNSLNTRVHDHLATVITGYSATAYIVWSSAITNVSTNQKAFTIKKTIQTKVEDSLTQAEKDSIVEIRYDNTDWFPTNVYGCGACLPDV